MILLLFAAAVPATAQTFGFSLGSSAGNVCLAIGAATYRVSASAVRPDYTVRIDPGAASPDLRIHVTEMADSADFVLVDDGETPANCHTGSSTRTVRVSTTAPAPDMVVGLSSAAAADYRIYVRSERLSPEAAAALFAVSRRPLSTAIAGH